LATDSSTRRVARWDFPPGSLQLPLIIAHRGDVTNAPENTIPAFRKALELGVELSHTWSCYKEEEEACGVCDSCRLRLRGFEEAGVTDPIAYQS